MDGASFPAPRITPWVLRLLALMAGVQLVLETIVTSDVAKYALTFDPHTGLTRPWTILTYAFVHGGLFHLLFNGLALFVFGPTVERRLGGPAFLLYFTYCVVGAAAFAMIVDRIAPVPPFVGASGGVLGLILAYSIYHPDNELIAFPIPIPIRARTFVMLIAIYDLCGMLFLRSVFHDGIAHEAHLGGLAAGWLFFRLQGARYHGDAPGAPRRPVEAKVAVRAIESARSVDRAPDRPAPRPPSLDPTQAELDRVLDKISATGMNSLTPTERKFLDEVAKKKQDH